MRIHYLHRAFKARYRDQRFEIRAILSALRRGDVAVDAGAHKGAFLYWLRRAVGAGGGVFAYEPQARLAAYLRSVAAAMRWSNVEVRECALSDTAGTGTLHIPGNGYSAWASLDGEVLRERPGERCECRIDTLDRQLAGGGRVALLKVDVEGHELQVFRGGEGILTRDRPLLLFECEGRHLRNHSLRDVFGYLEGLGYTGAFFSPRGLLPLEDFDPAVHQRRDAEKYWDSPEYCNNFLFRHPGGQVPAKKC
jgi:FkbM family methyltransferase